MPTSNHMCPLRGFRRRLVKMNGSPVACRAGSKKSGTVLTAEFAIAGYRRVSSKNSVPELDFRILSRHMNISRRCILRPCDVVFPDSFVLQFSHGRIIPRTSVPRQGLIIKPQNASCDDMRGYAYLCSMLENAFPTSLRMLSGRF